MIYTIIVNQPGYLPETEPYEVDSEQEARDALEHELTETLGHEYGTANSDPNIVTAPDGSMGAAVGGYVHEARPTQPKETP